MSGVLNIARQFGEKLDLKPIPPIEPITVMPVEIKARALRAGPPADGDPVTLMARRAVAQIAKADGFHSYAAHCLTGAFDDDTDMRIALAAARMALRSIAEQEK